VVVVAESMTEQKGHTRCERGPEPRDVPTTLPVGSHQREPHLATTGNFLMALDSRSSSSRTHWRGDVLAILEASRNHAEGRT
jgi:hypothetical protein